jgi:DNA-binding transcriptional regulator YiaG
MKKIDYNEIRAFRKKMQMNQQEFWGKVCVTQSGGSRYENQRDIPLATKVLLHLVYVEKQDISKVIKHVSK